MARALEKNEALRIERAAVDAAEAAVSGAQGAYDPLLGLNAGWNRTTPPVNSSFSGAPPGQLAPTDEVAEAGASLVQLLPSGGAVTVRAGSGRTETTDGSFAFLSPAYEHRHGRRDPAAAAARGRRDRHGADDAQGRRSRARSCRRGPARPGAHRVGRRGRARLLDARRGDREEVGVQEEAVRARRGAARAGRAWTASTAERLPTPRGRRSRARRLERRRGELLAARESVARAESALKLLILSDDGEAGLWGAPFAPVEKAEVEEVAVDVPAAMAGRWPPGRSWRGRRRRSSDGAPRRRSPRTASVGPRPGRVVDRFGLAGSRNPAAAPVPGLPAGCRAGSRGGSAARSGGSATATSRMRGSGWASRSRSATAPPGPPAVGAETERQAAAELARARKAVRAEVLDAVAALETADQRIEAARAG